MATFHTTTQVRTDLEKKIGGDEDVMVDDA